MLRIALSVLIMLSALPFAATARRATLSDVRAAEVQRPAATSTAPPQARTPSPVPTPTPARQPDTPDNAPRPTSPPRSVAPPPTATDTPEPPPGTGIDLVIATRGDHRLPHDITLDSSIRRYSWGKHGTEDNKALPDDNNTVAPWLVVQRDESQLDLDLDVRFNIRNIRCYSYQPSTGRWIEIYSGLPGWMVSSDLSTAGDYVPISPTVEGDGSYSFDIPTERALHMSSGVWQPEISESDGILTVVDARLIGSDVGEARIAVAPGADFRTGDDDRTTNQSGFGHLGLLTSQWTSYPMLSSALSDDEIRANPPPF